MIIVPGHGLFRDEVPAGESPEFYERDTSWKGDYFKGEGLYCVEYVQAGLKALRKHANAILIFSGGHTIKEDVKWSQAQSYLAIAQSLPEWEPALAQSILTEDYAKDSIQNIAFALLRYAMGTGGKFPEKITVMNWAFKADRFDLHREALGIPKEIFNYIKVNNLDEKVLGRVEAEDRKLMETFKQDPFGLKAELSQKRRSRNPHDDQNPYSAALEHFPYKINKDQIKRLVLS